MSDFPNGFASGVAVRKMPILNTYGKNVYWVDTNKAGASNANDGSFNRPWKTVAFAVSSTNNTKIAAGDIVMVAPGHTETVSAAGTITMNVAGVSVIGLGQGDRRPVFTWSATAATWAVSAANCAVQNVVCTNSIDGVTKAFNITAAGFYFDGDAVDSTSLIEFQRFILGSSAADNMYINLRYRGQTGGDNCVAPIQLVGTDEARINVSFYGLASTAVVNFITTASTGIRVTGEIYNSGTGGTKNVVDTQGSSIWWADIRDGVLGTQWTAGGIGATATATAAPSTYTAIKSFTATGTSLTTGLSPVSAFTVTGTVQLRVYGVTGATPLASTANNGTLSVGISGTVTAFLGTTTMDGTNFTAGTVWIDTSPTLKTESFVAANLAWNLCTATTITVTVATNSSTAGVLTLYCEWKPISPGASVVAA